MTRFLHWRKMTWAIVLWSVATTAWLIAGGAVIPSFLLWSFGAIVLTLVWFITRPLWRHGHGVRIRRLRSADPGPVRSFESLSTGH
jgi:hypothetical protein